MSIARTEQAAHFKLLAFCSKQLCLRKKIDIDFPVRNNELLFLRMPDNIAQGAVR